MKTENTVTAPEGSPAWVRLYRLLMPWLMLASVGMGSLVILYSVSNLILALFSVFGSPTEDVDSRFLLNILLFFVGNALLFFGPTLIRAPLGRSLLSRQPRNR